jgi:hypothetical protein
MEISQWNPIVRLIYTNEKYQNNNAKMLEEDQGPQGGKSLWNVWEVKIMLNVCGS